MGKMHDIAAGDPGPRYFVRARRPGLMPANLRKTVNVTGVNNSENLWRGRFPPLFVRLNRRSPGRSTNCEIRRAENCGTAVIGRLPDSSGVEEAGLDHIERGVYAHQKCGAVDHPVSGHFFDDDFI